MSETQIIPADPNNLVALGQTEKLLQEARAVAVAGDAPSHIIRTIDDASAAVLTAIKTWAAGPQLVVASLYSGTDFAPPKADQGPKCWCGERKFDIFHDPDAKARCTSDPCYHHEFRGLLDNLEAIESWNKSHEKYPHPNNHFACFMTGTRDANCSEAGEWQRMNS